MKITLFVNTRKARFSNSLCRSICACCESSMDGHLHLLHIFTFKCQMLSLKHQGSQISLQSNCVPFPSTAVISKQGTQPTLSLVHYSICLAT